MNEWSGVGNHNTAEFWEYDSRTGRRGNLDPIIRYWESRYACLSNSPIWKTDPLGNTDFYSQAGILISKDGKYGNGVVVVITDDEIAKKIAKKKATIYDVSPKDQFQLPPFNHRQEIKKIMSTVPAKADYEVGGRGVGKDGDYQQIRAKDGDSHDIAKANGDGYTEINLGSTHGDYKGMKNADAPIKYWLYTWHSHPGNSKMESDKKYVSGEIYSDKTQTQTTRSSMQKPSDLDIKSAEWSVHDNFVISPEDKKVYFYNYDTNIEGRSGSSGNFDIELFYNVQEEGAEKISKIKPISVPPLSNININIGD